MKLNDKDCCLYWIHLPEHICIGSEGYVGVATNFNNRMLQHQHYTYKEGTRYYQYHLYRALRKYGKDVLFQKVFTGSCENILFLENVLRPHEAIGWNQSPGGISPTAGRITSQETRKKQSDARKGMPPWKAFPRFNYIWAIADTAYIAWKLNGWGRKKLAKAFGFTENNFSNMVKKFKSGWIPRQDPSWITFQQNYMESN